MPGKWNRNKRCDNCIKRATPSVQSVSKAVVCKKISVECQEVRSWIFGSGFLLLLKVMQKNGM